MSQTPTRSKLPPVTTWQAEFLRLTVFPDPGAAVEHSKWWRTLVGNDPDVSNSQPKQKLFQERGKLDDQSDLLLQVQVNRVDWILLPPESDEPAAPGSSFSSIGTFPSALDRFSAVMHRWLPSCPPAMRFALAGVVLQPQPNKMAGYLHLAPYIQGVTLDPDSSDFLYQINRPRPTGSSIEGLTINRLTKWSVSRLQRVLISSGAQAVTVGTLEQEFACRLEFDVNTSQEFRGPLPQQKLETLLAEFLRWATEIAEHGDIK